MNIVILDGYALNPGDLSYDCLRQFGTLTIYDRTSMTLCDPMNYSLLGSSVHGILQARILVWVAISFSRGSS